MCDNVATSYAAVEEGFASAPLPEFVKDEFEGYLDCGILCRGAALLCQRRPSSCLTSYPGLNVHGPGHLGRDKRFVWGQMSQSLDIWEA